MSMLQDFQDFEIVKTFETFKIFDNSLKFFLSQLRMDEVLQTLIKKYCQESTKSRIDKTFKKIFVATNFFT
jgi:hypothetical protein